MYLNYYNLKLKPFEESPDPKFLWLGEKHEEAIARLKYGILESKGFVLLTGEAGIGKSIVVNALAKTLGHNIIFGQISDPPSKLLDFFNLIADIFEMNKQFSSKLDFLSHLELFLNNAHVNNKNAVLIIEDAQKLDQKLLEPIRLLSNIEKPDLKLITVIYVAQNEFKERLKNNKALRQRISIMYNIERLTELETETYIMHRLKTAGSEKRIFSPGAITEIFFFSSGNPRMINMICDRALSIGFQEELKIIEPEVIKKCAIDLQLSDQRGKDEVEKDKISVGAQLEDTKIREPEVNGEGATEFQLWERTGIDEIEKEKVVPTGPVEDTKMEEPEIERAAVKFQLLSQAGKDEIDKEMAQADTIHATASNTIRSKPARRKMAYLASAAAIIVACVFGYHYFFSDNKAISANRRTLPEKGSGQLTAPTSETSILKSDEMAILHGDTAESKGKPVEVSPPESSEKVLRVQLRTRNEELDAALMDLKSAITRVAELGGAAAKQRQLLSQQEQELSELKKELAQEKKSKEQLQAELSSRADVIVGLQQKQDTLKAEASRFEKEIKKKTKEVTNLKDRLQDLDVQKASAATRLGQLKAENDKLQAAFKDLKNAKARITVLEGAAAEKEQLLSQTNKKLSELTKELEQEKTGRKQLQAELSSKAAVIAGLQQKQDNLQAEAFRFEKEIDKKTKEITRLKGRLQDVDALKASTATRLGQLKTENDKLQAAHKDLKNAKARITVLEGVAAEKEQLLSQTDQKLSELTKELVQEKKGRKQLQAELSAKTALVAGLQEKRGALQADALKFEGEIEKRTKEIDNLQDQLLDLRVQKTSAETELGPLKSRYAKLATELKELKSAKARVTELERAMVEKEQVLSRTEHKLGELTKELDQEKKSKGQLQAELSSKAALVARLQDKLKAAKSDIIRSEDEIRKNKKEIIALKKQLKNLEAQKASSELPPASVKPPAKGATVKTQTEQPSPTDIIDYIIKKKSE